MAPHAPVPYSPRRRQRGQPQRSSLPPPPMSFLGPAAATGPEKAATTAAQSVPDLTLSPHNSTARTAAQASAAAAL